MIRRTLAVLGFLSVAASSADAQPCPPYFGGPRALAEVSAGGGINGAFGVNDRGTLCGVGITNSGTVTPSSNQTGTTVGLVGTASSVVSAASASLERGELKASVGVNESFASGIAQARFNERLDFTNNSGEWRSFRLGFSVDGSISAGLAVRDFFSYIGLSTCAGCGNGAGQSITPDIVNNPSGFGVGLYAETVRAAGPHDPFQFRAQFGNLDWWDIDDAGDVISPGVRGHIEGNPGSLDYVQSILLWVPPGSTSLLIDAWLKVGPCGYSNEYQGAGGCNFGNTGAIRLADISGDLTWSSESGVFLSALDPIDPPPSVPEPSSMLLLAAGAGALVSVRRRRTHAHRALRLGLQPHHRARPRVAVDGQIE